MNASIVCQNLLVLVEKEKGKKEKGKKKKGGGGEVKDDNSAKMFLI